MLGINDMIFMGIGSIILSLLFSILMGEEPTASDKKVSAMLHKAPVMDFTYSVLSGSLNDAKPGQIFQNFTGGLVKGEIPMITSARKLITSTGRVLTGRDDMLLWATKNFGMLSPARGWAYDLNEARLDSKK